MNNLAMARSIASDQAQLAVDQMSRDLRQAQENVAEKGVFVTAEANQMRFTADLDHDTKPELVRYYVSGGSLLRTVALPTAGQTTPPFTFQAPGTPRVLVEELGASAGRDVLLSQHGREQHRALRDSQARFQRRGVG